MKDHDSFDVFTICWIRTVLRYVFFITFRHFWYMWFHGKKNYIFLGTLWSSRNINYFVNCSYGCQSSSLLLYWYVNKQLKYFIISRKKYKNNWFSPPRFDCQRIWQQCQINCFGSVDCHERIPITWKNFTRIGHGHFKSFEQSRPGSS